MAFGRKAKNTNNAPGNYQTAPRRSRSNPFGSSENVWFLRLIYWLAASVGVVFAAFNVLPYERAVRYLFGTAIADSGILEVVSRLPVLNAIAGMSLITAFWIIGIVFWGLLQMMELFEKFLKRNRAFVGATIDDAETHSKYAIRETDDPLLAGLKRLYNRLPLRTLRDARRAKLVAYSVDLLICIWVYPPTDGGFGRLMIVLLTGQWSLIDWGNVIALLATLFIVEIVVDILFWISDLIRFVKVGVQQPQ
ncbi:hypothetical protein H6F88_01945 [Oculatella sp. FACHB-28]|uniref:hypothetical protein n=1 Tax=Oculatella sp. FACHB-28 TaxID=2692845 RepID=UPI001684D341|nr:hypothetical protein [Oculatella sp. FACHB-28]MBD2054796.1 hypothetical protein [Oculatella sp. FACHB-28]